MPAAAPSVSAPEPAQLRPAPPYLPALTGLRAVAAYMVCLHHFNPFREGPGLSGWLYRVVLEFHVGVPIFFVLSGFLIALRYADSSATLDGPWWRRYLRNRVARIYPMYFLLTTLTFGVDFMSKGWSVFRLWLLNVTFLRGFFDDYKYSGIAQGWTLTVEECFYLWAPLAFWLLRRHPRRLWLQPLGLLAFGGGLVITLGALHHHGLFGNFRFMLLFTFFGRAVEFYVGIQLARWYQQGRLRAGAWAGLRTALGLLLMAAVVLALVAVRGPYDYGQESPPGVALNNFVLPLGIGLLFVGLLTEATWLRRLLASGPLQVLGKSSYVFYLIHMGVVQYWLRDHVTERAAPLLLLLLALSVVLYYLAEQPLNRWLRR